MSAYALSFAPHLVPVSSPVDKILTTPLAPLSTTYHENKHKTDIDVKVISASIDAGILVQPSQNKSLSKVNKNSFSLPNDAVRFKLSINRNGRKHVVTRTFQNFVTLRSDLMKELGFSKDFAEDRCNYLKVALPELPESISDQTDRNCHQLSNPSVSHGIKKDRNRCLSGFGFARIQTLLLCYYCPLMNYWLEEVINTAHVDTSTSLNNFLLEPLNDNDYLPSIICFTERNIETDSCNSSLTGSCHRSACSSATLEDFYDLYSDDEGE